MSRFIWASLLCVAFAVPSWAAPKKVLLVAGAPDGHPPRTHEFRAGVRVMEALLKPFDEVEVTAVYADGRWKEGPELIRRSDCVVLFLTQGFQWMQQEDDRLAALRELARRGGGVVALHWAIGAKDDQYIAAGLELLGGCHGGADRKYKVLTTDLKPAAPAHPVASGVEPLEVHDEFYYELKFAGPKEDVKPVMTADIEGEAYTVAWAWKRPDGGRSFGFSGLHFHDNWKRPEYRRLVTQGILWAAGSTIPADGVAVDVPDSVYQLEKE